MSAQHDQAMAAPRLSQVSNVRKAIKRNTSKDGSLFARAVAYFLRNSVSFWRWVGKQKRLGRLANSWLINRVVTSTRNRPHPWSTVSDYTSWLSLTDRTSFARHLQARTLPEDLPSVEAVAALFRRPEDGGRECSKSTMLFAAFAQYLTDSFLRTKLGQSAKTTSTHELDLSALYGRTEAQTDALRLKDSTKGRRGRLKSQFIGPEENGDEYPEFLFEDDDGMNVKREFELLDNPILFDRVPVGERRGRKIFAVGGDRANATPQVAMINTLFLREHNRIAKIIESGNKSWDEERVFQTARNILIPMFIKITLEDYINHISSLAFHLRAEPSAAWRAQWNRPNWMAVEFGLLYRWHSLVPDDIRWNGRTECASDMVNNNTFLVNAGIAAGLDSSSRQATGALGLFNTASFLLPIEASAIRHGRDNRVATYNDYRKAMGMEPVDRFDQITGDEHRIAALERLYERPDRVEFYAGLFAEDHIPNSPLPPLIGRMVAVDAFTQGLTNPLLSEHVFKNKETFTPKGVEMIENTRTLCQLAERNIKDGLKNGLVTMTRSDWKRVRAPF